MSEFIYKILAKFNFHVLDIEAQIRDIQSKKKEIVVEGENDKGVGLGESGYFDSEIYDGTVGKGKYEGYVTSIAANDENDDEEYDVSNYANKRGAGYNAPAALLNDVVQVSCKFDKIRL